MSVDDILGAGFMNPEDGSVRAHTLLTLVGHTLNIASVGSSLSIRRGF